jgi:hypothetical protein
MWPTSNIQFEVGAMTLAETIQDGFDVGEGVLKNSRPRTFQKFSSHSYLKPVA